VVVATLEKTPSSSDRGVVSDAAAVSGDAQDDDVVVVVGSGSLAKITGSGYVIS